MKNLMPSAISYVLATLLLSGQVLANPADVSGNVNQNTDTNAVANINLLAMNNHVTSEVNSFSFQVENTHFESTEKYSVSPEQLLNKLNSQMQNELEQRINQHNDLLF